MTRFDVIVSGAQLTGAATAVALARCGYQVLLLDTPRQGKATADSGINVRTTALSPSSIAWLEEFVIPKVSGIRVAKMHVWEDDGSASISFDCAKVNADNLAVVAMHRELVDSIRERAKDLVELRDDVAIERLDADVQTVHLSDGSVFKCDLLVIAEGGASATRSLAHAKIRRQRLHQSAIASVITTALPHANVAYQKFGKGILALLPCSNTNDVSLIWSVDDHFCSQLMKLDEMSFCNHLTVESEGKLGRVQEIGERVCFPLEQSLADSLNPHPWVLLVGDAAHSLHPLAGQGANLALEDVRALVKLLSEREDALADPDCLAQFANRRKMRARMLMGAMTFFYKVWQSNNPYFRLVRNVGVNSVDSLPLLKLQLIREAMGFGPMAKLN